MITTIKVHVNSVFRPPVVMALCVMPYRGRRVWPTDRSINAGPFRPLSIGPREQRRPGESRHLPSGIALMATRSPRSRSRTAETLPRSQRYQSPRSGRGRY
jgi:hypothetical protein